MFSCFGVLTKIALIAEMTLPEPDERPKQEVSVELYESQGRTPQNVIILMMSPFIIGAICSDNKCLSVSKTEDLFGCI